MPKQYDHDAPGRVRFLLEANMVPLYGLYQYLDMMLRDKWGYIYGTAGILWTQARQDAVTDEMAQKYGAKWIGHMVTDCSGVMVYIWRQYGLKIPHGSSSMVRQGYIVDCGSEPHPGWAALVDKTPETPDNDHIGIVGADGVTVYEAKGTQSGFVTSKVTDKKWTKFGRFVDVDYSEDKPMQTPYKAVVTLKSGSLNVRSGPGTEYSKIGKLSNGDTVTVSANYEAWSYISQPMQGYVASQYLTPIAPLVTPADDNEPDPGHDDPDAKWLLDPVLVSITGARITLSDLWRVLDDGEE